MTARTFSGSFGYTDKVLRNKPIRASGQDLRDFPTYTIPEAAIFLGVPQRTLWEWFSGNDPILSPSGYVNSLPLLSFKDMVEAYAVFLLRLEHSLSMQSIRRSLKNLPKYTSAKNPLVSENLKVLEDNLLLDKPARGKFGRHVINLSHDGQLVINHVVDIFASRVHRINGKASALYPWRFWKEDKSKPVEIDPAVMSGRLVITGTRIPVSVIKSRIVKESVSDIADDYGISVESVKKALMHVDKKAA